MANPKFSARMASAAALISLVQLAAGCKAKMIHFTSNGLADTAAQPSKGNTGKGTPPSGSTPGVPGTPLTPCTYSHAPRDLMFQPLPLTQSLTVLQEHGTAAFNTLIPYYSNDGGVTFPFQRVLPFDPVNSGSRGGFNNLGRLVYKTFFSSGHAGIVNYYQSADDGVSFKPVLAIPKLDRGPVANTSILVNPDETLLTVDMRFIQTETFQLTANTTYQYDSDAWQVRKIGTDGRVTILEEYLPAGFDGSQAMSISRGADGTLYASGFVRKVIIANQRGTFVTNLELRRSTDGGANWITIQSKPLGEVFGWQDPELFAVSDGRIFYTFGYTDSSNLSHSYVQIVNADGTVQDVTATILGTDGLTTIFARTPSDDHIALFTYKALSSGGFDQRTRGVKIVDMKTLTSESYDFVYNNDSRTEFQSARFLPGTKDLVFTGFTTDLRLTRQAYFTEAITCH